jgi:hypothetical protein
LKVTQRVSAPQALDEKANIAAPKTAPNNFRDGILRANIILFSFFEEPPGRCRAAA